MKFALILYFVIKTFTALNSYRSYQISMEELEAICAAAAKWTGTKGATRKLVVSEYVDRDPYDPTYEERTVHYAIYEVALSGKRVIYRHFLLLPTGAIVEIFEKLPVELTNINK